MILSHHPQTYTFRLSYSFTVWRFSDNNPVRTKDKTTNPWRQNVQRHGQAKKSSLWRYKSDHDQKSYNAPLSSTAGKYIYLNRSPVIKSATLRLGPEWPNNLIPPKQKLLRLSLYHRPKSQKKTSESGIPCQSTKLHGCNLRNSKVDISYSSQTYKWTEEMTASKSVEDRLLHRSSLKCRANTKPIALFFM